MKNVHSSLRMLIASLVFCSLFNNTTAQTLNAHPNTYLTSNCNGYYDYLPSGYSPTGSQTYPVLIAFGGISQNGDGSAAQLDYVFSNWGGPGWQIQNGKFPSSLTVNGQVFKFIVILPQFSSTASPKGVDDVISYILAHYKADATRIYLTGNSLGGGYCWDYPGSSVTYGQRIAAIVPTCAASTYTSAKANNIAAANLPVWATHNAVDGTVSPQTTINFVNGINAAPTPPTPRAKMTIFQDEGHNCADSTFNMTYGIGAYAWMLQYKRGGTSNQSPVAKAGNDITITLPTNSVQLNGSSSSDPDGTIASYSWSKTGGPTQYTLSSTTIANPTLSNLVAGTYTLRLTVTDNKGATATDDINVIVNPANQSPIAKAGSDVTITLPTNSVQLNGSSSSDPDGTIASYSWSKTAGPTQYTLSSTTIANPTLSNLVAGTYTLRLTVKDNKGATATDDINVTVNPAGTNQPPKANAGSDIVITLPVNTTTLTGSGTDADGTIASYLWSEISGPNTAGISSPTKSQTTITKLVQGTYVFQLKVTDNKGATGTDNVQVTVNAAGSITTKSVYVNVYGGSNPYNNSAWNNWNVGTASASNITSGLFKFSDGTVSTITSTLSYTEAIGDNGVTYSGGMAPAEVLRYTSYSVQERTLTIKGLLPTVKYNIELYASRYSTGNSTIFTINGTSVTITTYNNFTNKATFSNITPTAQGQIVVNIKSGANYNYLNGFMITQQGALARPLDITQSSQTNTNFAGAEEGEEESYINANRPLLNNIKSVEVFPNPVIDRVIMRVNNPKAGVMNVQIISANGSIKKQFVLKHLSPVSNLTIPVNELPAGAYIIKVKVNDWSITKKIIKS